jgi:hypothetical protein
MNGIIKIIRKLRSLNVAISRNSSSYGTDIPEITEFRKLERVAVSMIGRVKLAEMMREVK